MLLPFAGFLHILYRMDERTKSIIAIGQKIAGETARIDGCLRELGRFLLERSQDGRIAIERSTYDRINDETAQIDAAIRQIESGVERANEIDNKIADEERLNGEVQGQLIAIYPNLGRLVTGDECFSPYKTRIDSIQQKIDGLNERLTETGDKNNANVFAWLGRSAQSLVLKSLLAKTEASRERVYAEAGADFIRNQLTDGQAGSSELEALCTAAGVLKKEHDERDMRIIVLKEEKREILRSFGRDGNANRKKTEIRRRMEQLNRELDDLCLRLGRKAEAPSTQLVFQNLLDDEMEIILEDVAHRREIVKDYEDQTARLKVSLEIDAERADVEKLAKSIAMQRQRIATAEGIIARHDKRIAEANKRIADLMRN
jgi:hypothetical protein